MISCHKFHNEQHFTSDLFTIQQSKHLSGKHEHYINDYASEILKNYIYNLDLCFIALIIFFHQVSGISVRLCANRSSCNT